MSSMCTPMSISGPPPAVARRVNQLPSAGDALAAQPAGLGVVDRGRARPASMIFFSALTSPRRRWLNDTSSTRSVASAAVDHRPALAAFSAIGFSDSTCSPASRAATTTGRCSVVGVATLHHVQLTVADQVLPVGEPLVSGRCRTGRRAWPAGPASMAGQARPARPRAGRRTPPCAAGRPSPDRPRRRAAAAHRRRPLRGWPGRSAGPARATTAGGAKSVLGLGPGPLRRRWPAPAGCRGGGRPGTPGRPGRSRRPCPCPRRQQQPERNTSPPVKVEMKTSSSGAGMSKYSPYISCSSMTIGCGTPWAIGWPGRRSRPARSRPSLRQASEQVVPISRREDLGEVAGVQHEQAHPAEHPLVDALDDRVVDLVVGGVPPPGEHVGVVEHLLGQPVLGLVLGGGAHLARRRRGARAGRRRWRRACRRDSARPCRPGRARCARGSSRPRR